MDVNDAGWGHPRGYSLAKQPHRLLMTQAIHAVNDLRLCLGEPLAEHFCEKEVLG